LRGIDNIYGDENRRCDAVAKKSTLKNYLKTVTYEHANCTLTASTTSPDDITGTANADTFNASAGRLQDNDVINGGAGTDTLNASLAASGDAYLTSVEVLNITAINGSASIEGDKVIGATNLNVSGGGTLSYALGAAGIAYSVAGDGTSLTLTEAGSDTATNSVSVDLKAGKLGTLTLGTQATRDYETINLKIDGATSATLTEAGTPTFADTGDKIVVTGSGDFTLNIADELLGSHTSAPTAATIDATGHTGKLTLDIGALGVPATDDVDFFSAEKFTGVDAITFGTNTGSATLMTIQKVASGTELIVKSVEAAGDNVTATQRASAVNDQITVTLNNATAGSSIGLGTLTVDGFESATINSTGTDSSTVVVANSVTTIAGTANDKNLTITGDKKLTAGVENTWTNIVSTNTSGVDLTIAAGTDIKFVGGAGNDRVEMDTVADIAAADSIDGGTGKNTLAISDTIGTDFSAAQLNVLKNFQVLEYEGAQDFAAGTIAATVDLTKLTSANELFINGLLTTDTADTLTVKANDGFVLKMGGHTGNAGIGASALDVQITNALSAGTTNTVTLQLVDIVDDGTTSTATNAGLKIAGVEKLTIALLGNETVPTQNTLTAVDTYTLSDVDGAVLQEIVITSANTGKATDGTALASDSLTISGVESTLVRTLDASAFTGALSIAGMAGNFIATGATITGGSGANTITGGNGADIITTGKGADLVLGGTGADKINTGAGSDVVLAATGADTSPEKHVATYVETTLVTNDVAAITIFGKKISSFTALSTDAAKDQIGELVASLSANINADADLKNLVVASSNAGVLTVTTKVDGNFGTFTASNTGLTSSTATSAFDGTDSTDQDEVILGAGADFIHTGGGVDTVDLGANDLSTDTIYVLKKNEGGDLISNFEAGSVGSDVIKFAGDMVANGTPTATLQDMTKTGAIGANSVIIQVTTATAAGGADTAAEIATFLSGIDVTNIVQNDAFILALNDGTDTYLWSYTEGQATGTIVVAADELALVGVLKGVTSIANGDLGLLIA
jgi:hypothetical protein